MKTPKSVTKALRAYRKQIQKLNAVEARLTLRADKARQKFSERILKARNKLEAALAAKRKAAIDKQQAVIKSTLTAFTAECALHNVNAATLLLQK